MTYQGPGSAGEVEVITLLVGTGNLFRVAGKYFPGTGTVLACIRDHGLSIKKYVS